MATVVDGTRALPLPRIAAEAEGRRWAKVVAGYAQPQAGRSVRQLAGNAIAFLTLWVTMAWLVDRAYWLTLCLALPAAGFMMRLFIIQHDCGHGSFLPRRVANDRVGRLLGVLTITPYEFWRRAHAIHHGNLGDLDRRSIGEINTLTVAEYLAASRWRRLLYRAYRSPLVIVGLGGIFQFFVRHRLPIKLPAPRTATRRSILGTNAAILVFWCALGWVVGPHRAVLVELPILFLMAWIGMWLFFAQHQFEETYWTKSAAWDFYEAGLCGSSFFDLPPWLQWFSGHIGLHHIHHLCTRVPNYRLPECLRDHPELARFNRLTVRDSLRNFRLALWDEDAQRLITFRDLRGRAHARSRHATDAAPGRYEWTAQPWDAAPETAGPAPCRTRGEPFGGPTSSG